MEFQCNKKQHLEVVITIPLILIEEIAALTFLQGIILLDLFNRIKELHL